MTRDPKPMSRAKFRRLMASSETREAPRSGAIPPLDPAVTETWRTVGQLVRMRAYIRNQEDLG